MIKRMKKPCENEFNVNELCYINETEYVMCVKILWNECLSLS